MVYTHAADQAVEAKAAGHDLAEVDMADMAGHTVEEEAQYKVRRLAVVAEGSSLLPNCRV